MTISDSTLARIKANWTPDDREDPSEQSSLFESPTVAEGGVSGELVLTHWDPAWRFVEACLYIHRSAPDTMASEAMGELTFQELVGLRSVVNSLIEQWEAAIPEPERA